MKYIIVAILAALLGAGIEFERSTYDIKLVGAQLGVAYGCGRNAGMMYAIKMFKPDEAGERELPQCSTYRLRWEALQ
jgi:hypothetical protein